MSFGQVPFLSLIESAPSKDDSALLQAIARVAPFLVTSSVYEATKQSLPTSSEVYILQTEALNSDQIYAFLDNGARKLVTKDITLIGQVPADRLILHLDPTTATSLTDPQILAGISGTLLETPTVAENLLKSFRAALKLAEGRPRDLFVLAASRDRDSVLAQPAALKIMSKTVGGVSVVPLQFLSTTLAHLPSPHAENGKLPVTTLFTSTLRSDREDGLYPTIPVSATSVPLTLGLVYSSSASVASSIISGNAVYFSRSRNGLWRKGETSGAMQMVERIRYDCDADALEFTVIETGPNGEKDGFCHVPDQVSCFGGVSGLAHLESTLKSRMKEAPQGSYTARLFSEPALLRAKIMEEAGELCEATSKQDIAAEAADLLYFALAKCVSAGVGLRDVSKILDDRSLKVTRRKGDAKKEWADKLGLNDDQAVGVAGGVGAGKEGEKTVAKEEPTAADAEEAKEDLRCITHDLAAVNDAERLALLKRPTASSSDMIARVNPILNTVREGGDEGLRSLVVKFDRCAPAEDKTFPLVLKAPFPAESMQLDDEVKAAIDQAYSNIKAFHQAQMDKESGTLRVETMPGVVCTRFARPIERVGLYVPGGTAILPSTALMLAVPAQVAKCSTLTLATPPRPDGTISPEIVYIASLTGVGSIVRAGGAHAVAAMAYGTETVPKVDKVRFWVVATVDPDTMLISDLADFRTRQPVRHCCQDGRLDGFRGLLRHRHAGRTIRSLGEHSGLSFARSELISLFLQVIADQQADPAFVASDLLSQAEHGADSQVILLAVALSDDKLAQIESEIKQQALALPRVDIIRKSIAHSLIIKCPTLEDAMTFSNAYAPEHLILQLNKASEVVSSVTNAGSVFVGAYSPESCGDYASGTNHTLPTAGW